MKTVTLHIGLHKTGTTSIQDGLAAVAADLRAQGVDYVPVCQDQGGGHHNLVRDLVGASDYDPERGGWDRLLTYIEAAPSQHFVISAEDFSRITTSHIHALAKRLEPYDVRVVLVIRNQVDYLQSLYSETVRGFSTEEPEAFVDRQFHEFDAVLHYTTLQKNWRRVFGRNAVTTIIYENVRGDLFRGFLKESGLGALAKLKTLPRIAERHSNASRSEAFLDINRRICQEIESFSDGAAYYRNFPVPLDRTAASLGWEKSDAPLFPSRLRREILKRVRADNRRLEKDLDTALPASYFETDNRPGAVMDASKDEVIELFAAFMVFQRQNAYRDQALLRAKHDDPAGARADMNKAIALNPNRPDLYKDLAHIFLKTGDYEGALKAAEEAATKAPDEPLAHHFKGVSLSLLGRREEAVESLERALELHPSQSPSLNWLFRTLMEMDRWEEAEAVATKAYYADPFAARPAINRALALNELNRPAEAETALREAVRRDPNIELAHAMLAATLDRQGQIQAAIDCLEEALEHLPGNSMLEDRLDKVRSKAARAKSEQSKSAASS